MTLTWKDVIHIFILSIVGTLLFVSHVVPVSGAMSYNISGDSSYINDSKAFIMATPTHLNGSGYVYVNLTAKQYNGDVDILIGVDGKEFNPTKIEYLKSDNVTWKSISNYFNAPTFKEYGDMDRWYIGNNFPVTAQKLYQIRIFFNMKFGWRNELNGKYWISLKPSSMTIQQAINNNAFYSLDPHWFSPTYQSRINFTIFGGDTIENTSTTIFIYENTTLGANIVNIGANDNSFPNFTITDIHNHTMNFFNETSGGSGSNEFMVIGFQNNQTQGVNQTYEIYFNGTNTVFQGEMDDDKFNFGEGFEELDYTPINTSKFIGNLSGGNITNKKFNFWQFQGTSFSTALNISYEGTCVKWRFNHTDNSQLFGLSHTISDSDRWQVQDSPTQTRHLIQDSGGTAVVNDGDLSVNMQVYDFCIVNQSYVFWYLDYEESGSSPDVLRIPDNPNPFFISGDAGTSEGHLEWIYSYNGTLDSKKNTIIYSDGQIEQLHMDAPFVFTDHPANITYTSTDGLNLNSTCSDEFPDTQWYTYTNGTNFSYGAFNHSFTLGAFNDGQQSIVTWCNDTINNLNSSTVYFSVQTPIVIDIPQEYSVSGLPKEIFYISSLAIFIFFIMGMVFNSYIKTLFSGALIIMTDIVVIRNTFYDEVLNWSNTITETLTATVVNESTAFYYTRVIFNTPPYLFEIFMVMGILSIIKSYIFYSGKDRRIF